MWLPTDIALWLMCGLGLMGVAVRPVRRVPAWLGSLLRETAIVLGIYAVWRLMGTVSGLDVGQALPRAERLWRLERTLHLPNEATLEHAAEHAVWFLRFLNGYYIVAHVLPLGVFLVWLYFRHRDRYPAWRNILGATSLGCMLIQLIPVAPPRMFPQFGFFDAAARYGPRVYDDVGANTAGQLAAMPSMHVAWALVIGIAAVRCSRSRWRWLALLHPLFTVLAVTLTGYHWLMDGVVAGAVLVLAMSVGILLRPVQERFRQARAARATERAPAL